MRIAQALCRFIAKQIPDVLTDETSRQKRLGRNLLHFQAVDHCWTEGNQALEPYLLVPDSSFYLSLLGFRRFQLGNAPAGFDQLLH
jgi:hypothetical protein